MDKSIYFACLFVSNKRQNCSIDRAQILCGTSNDPREGLWTITISKISLNNFDFLGPYFDCQIFDLVWFFAMIFFMSFEEKF